MSTATDSAQLILKLYELRREPVLRQARDWVGREFNPTTWEQFVQLVSGDKNAWFRMVLGYWEMAASLVTCGAIDPVMFRASNGEMIAVFAKVEPFLAQMRGGQAEFLQHMEQVVRETPGAMERLPQIREGFQAMAKAAAAAGMTPASAR